MIKRSANYVVCKGRKPILTSTMIGYKMTKINFKLDFCNNFKSLTKRCFLWSIFVSYIILLVSFWFSTHIMTRNTIVKISYLFLYLKHYFETLIFNLILF